MSGWVEPEWAMVTVMFVDIRGFTAYADRSTAREATDHLNAFFEVTVPVVQEHGGHVNKLLGDGLLAVFGAPGPLADHADRALAAGRVLVDVVPARLGVGWAIGIGINSGLVLVGTIGTQGHRELGVVGDPVNVAARLESATRELSVPLLVTEATRCLLDRDADDLAAMGSLALRGKSQPVVVHGLQFRNASRTPRP